MLRDCRSVTATDKDASKMHEVYMADLTNYFTNE